MGSVCSKKDANVLSSDVPTRQSKKEKREKTLEAHRSEPNEFVDQNSSDDEEYV